MSEAPLRGVLNLGAPGEDLELYRGEGRLGGIPVGSVRIWMPMRHGLDVRWRADDLPRSARLERTKLAIEHPDLGAVELAVDVTHSDGWGASPGGSMGPGDALARIVVHWANLPQIHPTSLLTGDGTSWVGRWLVESCGWRFTLDSRPDLGDC